MLSGTTQRQRCRSPSLRQAVHQPALRPGRNYLCQPPSLLRLAISRSVKPVRESSRCSYARSRRATLDRGADRGGLRADFAGIRAGSRVLARRTRGERPLISIAKLVEPHFHDRRHAGNTMTALRTARKTGGSQARLGHGQDGASASALAPKRQRPAAPGDRGRQQTWWSRASRALRGQAGAARFRCRGSCRSRNRPASKPSVPEVSG